jgi:hypothetical protein
MKIAITGGVGSLRGRGSNSRPNRSGEQPEFAIELVNLALLPFFSER